MSISLTNDTIIAAYYYLAIFSTLVFAIKLVLFTITGGDSEVIADFNSEIDTDCSFNFVSIQSVLAFFMAFGWMGYAGLKQFGFSHVVNVLVAILVGLAFMAGTAFLMFSVRKLEKNVKKDYTTALNKIGKAYTHFAPNAEGQIEIEINEQLSVVNAINTTNEEIKAFTPIKVVKIENETLFIEKAE